MVSFTYMGRKQVCGGDRTILALNTESLKGLLCTQVEKLNGQYSQEFRGSKRLQVISK